MASLNTLRTRGGIVISTVIGIALLAFLLGDFGTRGCTQYNVGEINGRKISYEDYGKRNDRYTIVFQSMNGVESLSAADQDFIRNMVWESFVIEHSFRPGLKRLGLWVSEAEQIDMVSGMFLSPFISSTFANPNTGSFDPSLLRNFVSRMDSDPTGRMRVTWEYLMDQMNNQRTMSKYMKLTTLGLYVNDLEIETALTAANNSYNARVVSKSYSLIPDSMVNVAGSDIRAYYNANRNSFRQQPSREIEYVVFDLLPSDEDYAESQKHIEAMAEEFRASENPMQFAVLNSQVSPSTAFLKESQVDADMRNVIWGKPEAMYGPVLSGDTYTLAREAEVQMMPDSVGASHILIRDNKELADSLLGVLRRGGDFAAIANQYSEDPGSNMKGGDLGIFPPDQMVVEFRDAVINGKIGEITTVETTFGTHIVKTTFRSAPVRKAQIAVIKYRVDPSAITDQGIYGEASRFLSEASASYDNFRKAAAEAGMSKRVARIKANDTRVNDFDDSRELVRWAFNARKGEVSGIMKIDDSYVIAALTGVREEGIADLEDAVDAIRPAIVREKKSRMLIEQFNGSTLDEVASNAGIEIIPADSITFNSFFIDNIGIEPRLIGGISATTETDRLSRPVTGNSGVFLFDVTDIMTSENSTAEDERVRIEASSTSYLPDRLNQAMLEASRIKDWRVKFF